VQVPASVSGVDKTRVDAPSKQSRARTARWEGPGRRVRVPLAMEVIHE
jgi:hypothetical protein